MAGGDIIDTALGALGYVGLGAVLLYASCWFMRSAASLRSFGETAADRRNIAGGVGATEAQSAAFSHNEAIARSHGEGA